MAASHTTPAIPLLGSTHRSDPHQSFNFLEAVIAAKSYPIVATNATFLDATRAISSPSSLAAHSSLSHTV
jgi:hypothetical protein